MLLLSSTSSFPATQTSLLTSSSSSSSSTPSSLSSSLSQTEVRISDGTTSSKSEGFLLAILGYNCQSTAMMASGAILIFVFFVVIPGFGLTLVVRKQYKDTNRFINMTNRVRTISQQSASPSCVVSTSGNNFHDFSRPSRQTGDLGVTSGVGVVDYRSCHESNAIHPAPLAATTAVGTTQTTHDAAASTSETASNWTNNFITSIFASRSNQRYGYVELP